MKFVSDFNVGRYIYRENNENWSYNVHFACQLLVTDVSMQVGTMALN